MTLQKTLMSAVAGAALLSGTGAAMAMDEITVGYFLEWPMPFEYAKLMGTYDKEMGVKVNWVSFDTGTAMSAAMDAAFGSAPTPNRPSPGTRITRGNGSSMVFGDF